MMTIQRAKGSYQADPKGFVMFGTHPDSTTRKWFERWYETAEKAVAYASKRGWPYTVRPDTNNGKAS